MQRRYFSPRCWSLLLVAAIVTLGVGCNNKKDDKAPVDNEPAPEGSAELGDPGAGTVKDRETPPGLGESAGSRDFGGGGAGIAETPPPGLGANDAGPGGVGGEPGFGGPALNGAAPRPGTAPAVVEEPLTAEEKAAIDQAKETVVPTLPRPQVPSAYKSLGKALVRGVQGAAREEEENAPPNTEEAGAADDAENAPPKPDQDAVTEDAEKTPEKTDEDAVTEDAEKTPEKTDQDAATDSPDNEN